MLLLCSDIVVGHTWLLPGWFLIYYLEPLGLRMHHGYVLHHPIPCYIIRYPAAALILEPCSCAFLTVVSPASLTPGLHNNMK
jgi:hypothetical protein